MPYQDPDGGEGGLYVHVPFCLRKCGYCDFYSLPLDRTLAETTVAALIAELDREAPRLPFAIRTIFVGGGTPTVLPGSAFERLFDHLGQLGGTGFQPVIPCGTGFQPVILDSNAAGTARPTRSILEFTVEANPDTFDVEKATILRQAGVNRISLGAQSFIPEELRTLDRAHHPQTVLIAVELAHEIGFEHLSLDLIFGIPGQTPASWRKSLEAACALPIDHLSCYGLTYEPDTTLTALKEAGQITPMDEGQETELFEMTGPILSQLGFARYEISNFARVESQAESLCHQQSQAGRLGHTKCRHNLFYWNNQPYLGVGPSAASFVSGERRKKISDLAAYLAAIREGHSPVESCESRDQEGFAHDLAMLRLRLTEGIDVADFQRRSGLEARRFFADAIEKHVAAGLLEDTGTHLRLTAKGLLLANVVTADFV